MSQTAAPRKEEERGSATRLPFYLFLGLFHAAWVGRVLLLPVDNAIENEWLRQGWSQGCRVLLWIVPVLVFLKCVDRTPPLTFLRLDRVPRGKAQTYALCIMGAFIAIGTVSLLFLQGGTLEKLSTLTLNTWLISAVGTAFVAVAEEVMYRGFVFRKLRATLSFHKANAAAATLFVLIHWPGWLYMQGFHTKLFMLSGSVLLIAWVLALLVELTDSLWPAIVLHFGNNMIAGLLLP